jgi:two-component SAPR family response regulator
MNGVELSRIVRSLRPALPVLYTSGYTENAVIHHGRLDPGVQLLEKPFTRTELARHVQRALAHVPTKS